MFLVISLKVFFKNVLSGGEVNGWMVVGNLR